jgi:hypothetical protein
MSGRNDEPDRMWVVGLALVFGTAFLARLVPLLNGGGLYALGNYDDGVHYAVAMGFGARSAAVSGLPLPAPAWHSPAAGPVCFAG